MFHAIYSNQNYPCRTKCHIKFTHSKYRPKHNGTTGTGSISPFGKMYCSRNCVYMHIVFAVSFSMTLDSWIHSNRIRKPVLMYLCNWYVLQVCTHSFVSAIHRWKLKWFCQCVCDHFPKSTSKWFDAKRYIVHMKKFMLCQSKYFRINVQKSIVNLGKYFNIYVYVYDFQLGIELKIFRCREMKSW